MTTDFKMLWRDPALPNRERKRLLARLDGLLKRDIDVPILHLPQLLGLAFGLSPEALRVNHHVVSTRPVLEKIAVKV